MCSRVSGIGGLGVEVRFHLSSFGGEAKICREENPNTLLILYTVSHKSSHAPVFVRNFDIREPTIYFWQTHITGNLQKGAIYK